MSSFVARLKEAGVSPQLVMELKAGTLSRLFSCHLHAISVTSESG